MDTKEICEFKISMDLLEKFNVAVMLNREDKDVVIEKLISEYIADSFLKVSQIYRNQNKVKTISSNTVDSNFGKANNKIPNWTRKPQQNNHRIIKAFFEVESELGNVPLDILEARCCNEELYPKTFTSDFKGNFNQMKTDSHNAHGKVFVTKDGIVELWEIIKDTLMENKKFFVNS